MSLTFGLLNYAFLAGGIFHQINTKLSHVGMQPNAPGIARPADDTPRINILGIPGAVSVLITGLLCIPSAIYANDFAVSYCRRSRERLDECLERGRAIRVRRGRCPGCGDRLGPG